MLERQGFLKSHGEPISVIVRFIDLVFLVLSGWAAYALRFGLTDAFSIRSDYVAVILGVTLLFATLAPIFGVYRSWRGAPYWSASARAFLALSAVFVVLLLLLAVTHNIDRFSRLWLGYWGVSAGGAFALLRVGAYASLSWLRRRGYNVRRVLIFGGGELGLRIAEGVAEQAWTGFEIVAVLDDDPSKEGKTVGSIRVRTDTQNLCSVLNKTDAHEVWLALPLRAEDRVHEILHDLRHSVVNIRMMPDVFGLRLLNHSITELAGIPTLNLTETPLTGGNRLLKAIEDKLIAITILLLISPVLLIVSIGVKLSSPGPVFHRQERVGWNGRPFMMLKFRSMPTDSETGSGAMWTTKGDSRPTRFGAFLRRTSLDELPQFFNVLSGDMSVVGPRPERPVFVDKFKDEIPDYMQKHLVKAGITGWAQVNGWRGNTDITKRVEHDLYYIEHWSLGFDLAIIARTIVKGFINEHAY